jgi:hypothetical protein
LLTGRDEMSNWKVLSKECSFSCNPLTNMATIGVVVFITEGLGFVTQL